MNKIPFTNKSKFKTPDNYFNTFESRLMDRIELENSSVKKVKLHSKKPYYYSLVAASAALIIGLSTFFINSQRNHISADALENYLEYNASITLSPEFINSFDEQDIKELENTINYNQAEINEYVLSDIDLEYYLNY
ncbi:hypothetical protein [Myroides injenensis]|uniref:hypothetical protein n=1 Tax=Myroides injenensis TaxID=1183151 RepID=UPI00028851B0|nr:hypothetical protein [Myroides injenensis]